MFIVKLAPKQCLSLSISTVKVALISENVGLALLHHRFWLEVTKDKETPWANISPLNS